MKVIKTSTVTLDDSSRILYATDYSRIRNAYYGAGGYADGSYLVRHYRESDRKYAQRQNLSYFLNYTEVTANAHVDPIFRSSIQRDWSNNSPLFDMFIEDVDGNGTSLHQFMSRAALYARLFGTVFIIMDNSATQSETLNQAIENREFPYLLLITPDMIDINRCEMDNHGRITKFCYKEKKTPEHINSIDYQWRAWDDNGWCTLNDSFIPTESGIHGLSTCPVIQLNSRDGRCQLIHQSQMQCIVQCNDAIYQLSSWLTEILASQTFSILTYPIQNGQEASELQVGTNNALAYPADSSHEPGYISPDSGPASTIQEQIKMLVEQIYRMASMSATTGTTTQLSGVAKRWDFEQQNTAISHLASMCQKAELAIATMFENWTNESVDYNVSYPTDFNITDVDAEIDAAIKSLQLDSNSILYRTEVMKKALTAYLPDISPDTFDAIIEEIQQHHQDNNQDNKQQADDTEEDNAHDDISEPESSEK